MYWSLVGHWYDHKGSKHHLRSPPSVLDTIVQRIFESLHRDNGMYKRNRERATFLYSLTLSRIVCGHLKTFHEYFFVQNVQ